MFGSCNLPSVSSARVSSVARWLSFRSTLTLSTRFLTVFWKVANLITVVASQTSLPTPSVLRRGSSLAMASLMALARGNSGL